MEQDVCPRCKTGLVSGALYCQACGKKIVPTAKKPLKRANGMGTVYKLQGRRRKPWVAAKNKVVIGYYEKRTEALEALEKASGKSLSNRYNMTFSEVYEAWKQEKFPRVGKSSRAVYANSFRLFSPLHDRKFRELRTSDFQNIIDQHLDMSHSMLNAYKSLVAQMSKWAVREELTTVNYAALVTLPKAQKKEKEIFSDHDIILLEADCGETARIILMLIYTGMRIGELFSMQLADYHGSYLVGGEKTAAGKNRVIPIRPEGRKHYQYFAGIATGELLLSGYSGGKNPGSFRINDYYPLLEKLGIQRKTPHATRHTYASWAVRNHMAPEILQKILGHADYNTTANIYVHTNIDELVKAVENC